MSRSMITWRIEPIHFEKTGILPPKSILEYFTSFTNKGPSSTSSSSSPTFFFFGYFFLSTPYSSSRASLSSASYSVSSLSNILNTLTFNLFFLLLFWTTSFKSSFYGSGSSSIESLRVPLLLKSDWSFSQPVCFLRNSCSSWSLVIASSLFCFRNSRARL